MTNHDEIKTWILTELAKHLECEIGAINPEQAFPSLGIDSLLAFSITGELSEWIGQDLSATLLWEYPTIDSLARKVSELLADNPPVKQSEFNAILLAG